MAILNNDIVLHRNWLRALLAHDSPDWSFWASKILFASPAGRIDSAGDGMAVIGSGFKIGHGRPASEFTRTREVFGACAAAALYRRSLLDDLGGFDSSFFLVYEDADLNFRARLRGYRCLFVAQAEVVHRVNTSIRTFSHHYVFYGHRNSEFVFLSNMPTPLLLRFLPERLLFNLLSFVFFLFKGRAGSFLKAKVSALLSWQDIVRKRRAVQTSRILENGELRLLLERNWLAYRRKFSDQQ